jgi:lipoprotein-anchoring transpeptidase ErfK/SrfK
MKRIFLLTGLSAMIGLVAIPATAQDRYGQRPPVVVSPDLSAPWVMQLQRSPQGSAARNQQRRQKSYTMRPAEPRLYYAGRGAALHTARPGNSRVIAIQPRASEAVVRPRREIDPKYLPQVVDYTGPHGAGTIVIDTRENLLYLVEKGGKARRYGVGTGKPGFEWAGTHKVTSKREWPDWRPPAEMIAREKKKGRILPVHMVGGPENPLGARALYLGSTLYRIHGTNQPWTIGQAVSSGCIRMRNEDVVDLYDRVNVGARVIVM